MERYNKTEWKTGDLISQSKMAQIEDQLEAVTDNIIDLEFLKNELNSVNGYAVTNYSNGTRGKIGTTLDIGNYILTGTGKGSICMSGSPSLLPSTNTFADLSDDYYTIQLMKGFTYTLVVSIKAEQPIGGSTGVYLRRKTNKTVNAVVKSTDLSESNNIVTVYDFTVPENDLYAMKLSFDKVSNIDKTIKIAIYHKEDLYKTSKDQSEQITNLDQQINSLIDNSFERKTGKNDLFEIGRIKHLDGVFQLPTEDSNAAKQFVTKNCYSNLDGVLVKDGYRFYVYAFSTPECIPAYYCGVWNGTALTKATSGGVALTNLFSFNTIGRDYYFKVGIIRPAGATDLDIIEDDFDHVEMLIGKTAAKLDSIDLKTAFKNNLTLKSNYFNYSQGGLTSSNGATTATNRIRSYNVFPPEILGIKLPEGKRAWVSAFDAEGAYIGRYAENGVFSQESSVYAKDLTDFLFSELGGDSTYQYRVVIRNADDSAISPEDAHEILYYYATDNSLTLSNKVADAKAIGDISDFDNLQLYSVNALALNTQKMIGASYATSAFAYVGDYKYITITKGIVSNFGIGFTKVRPVNNTPIFNFQSNPKRTIINTEVPEDCKYIAIYYHNTNKDTTVTPEEVFSSIRIFGRGWAIDNKARTALDNVNNFAITTFFNGAKGGHGSATYTVANYTYHGITNGTIICFSGNPSLQPKHIADFSNLPDDYYSIPLLAGKTYTLAVFVTGQTEANKPLTFYLANKTDKVAIQLTPNIDPSVTQDEITTIDFSVDNDDMYALGAYINSNQEKTIKVAIYPQNNSYSLLNNKASKATIDYSLYETKDLTHYNMYNTYAATNGAIDSVVGVTHLSTSTAYDGIIVPCKAGDIFTVTGHGGDAPRLWAFTDENYKLLSRSSSDSQAEALVLKAEHDGYFMSAHHRNYSYSLIATQLQKVGTLGNAGSIRDAVYKTVDHTADFVNGKYVDFNTAMAQGDNTDYNCITLPCKAGDKFVITGTGGATGARLAGFFDTNKNIYCTSTSNAVAVDLELEAPIDGYFACNVLNTGPYSLTATQIFKAASEEVTSQVEFLTNDNYEVKSGSDMFEIGRILHSSGVADNTAPYATRRFRTKDYLDGAAGVRSKNGYKFNVFAYAKDRLYTYVGIWDGSSFVRGSTNDTYFMDGSFTLSDLGNYYFKVEGARSAPYDQIDVTMDNLNFIEILYPNKASKDKVDYSLYQTVDHTAEFTSGRYINLSVTYNNAVDIVNANPAESRSYIVLPCSAGDKFVLTGSATNAISALLWGFLDTDKKLLFKAPNSAVLTNGVLIAKNDGYFVCNIKHDEPYSLVATQLIKAASEETVVEMQTELEEAKTAINSNTIELANKAPAVNETVSGTFVTVEDSADNMPCELTAYINPVQSGTGDPSSENVRPISGWTAARINRTGKNLLGGDALRDSVKYAMPSATDDEENRIIKFTSSATVNASFTELCGLTNKFKPNTAYTFILTFSKNTGTGSNIRVIYTDGIMSYLSLTEETNEKQTIVFVSDPSKTVSRLGKTNMSGTTALYYDESGIFEGTLTADDFVPYQDNGECLEVTFPDEAGTVFGGTLTVHKDGTGTLAVNKRSITLTSDTVVRSGTINYAVIDLETLWAGVDGANKSLCNKLLWVDSQSSYRANTFRCYNSDAYGYFILTIAPPNGPFDTVTACKNATKTWITENEEAGNPVVVVYTIADPIMYELTSEQVEQVKMQYGLNNIWANTGDVAVTYPIDTKLHTQQLATQITNVETQIDDIEEAFNNTNDFAVTNYMIGTKGTIAGSELYVNNYTVKGTGVGDVVLSGNPNILPTMADPTSLEDAYYSIPLENGITYTLALFITKQWESGKTISVALWDKTNKQRRNSYSFTASSKRNTIVTYNFTAATTDNYLLDVNLTSNADKTVKIAIYPKDCAYQQIATLKTNLTSTQTGVTGLTERMESAEAKINGIVDLEKKTSFSGMLNATVGSLSLSSSSVAKCTYANIQGYKYVTVTKNAGATFAIGFTESTPKIGDSISGYIKNNNGTEIKTSVPANCNYIVIQFYSTTADGSANMATLYSSLNITGLVGAIDSKARTQIDTLTETTEKLEGSVYETIDRTGDYINYRRIQLNNVGSTVDITPNLGARFVCILLPCKAGDKFVLTAEGASSAEPWAFLDKNFVLLSKATNMTCTNLELTAEQDGYFVSNARNDVTYSLVATQSIGIVNRFESARMHENMQGAIAEIFDPHSPYDKDKYVTYEGKLYQFNTPHAAGAWVGTDANEVNVTDLLEQSSENIRKEVFTVYTGNSAFRFGRIDPTNGDAIYDTETQFIYKKDSYLPNEAFEVRAKYGYKMQIFAYDKNTWGYLGAWNGESLTKEEDGATWLHGTFKLDTIGDYFFQIMGANNVGSTITETDFNGIEIWSIDNVNKKLKSTDDDTDRTTEIRNILTAQGFCELGEGDFYVSNLNISASEYLYGQGPATRLILRDNGTKAVVMSQNSTIRDLQIIGAVNNLSFTTESTIGERCGIEVPMINSCGITIHNAMIRNFNGSGIYIRGMARNTSTVEQPFICCTISDCIVERCFAGIYCNMNMVSVANTSCSKCYYGVRINAQCLFANCIFNDNVVAGAYVTGKPPIFTGCLFRDLDSINEYALLVENMNANHLALNGCKFLHCGKIQITSAGSMPLFDGCTFYQLAVPITCNNNMGALFANCLFDSDITAAGNISETTSGLIKLNGCYNATTGELLTR